MAEEEKDQQQELADETLEEAAGGRFPQADYKCPKCGTKSSLYKTCPNCGTRMNIDW